MCVWRKLWWGLSLATIVVSGAACADIYVSHTEGTPRFATQKLDDSYALYLKTEVAQPALVLQPGVRAPMRAPAPALKALIDTTAARHQIDPVLLHALVWAESRYNARAVSPKGAAGYTQLMPATAARYGVKDRFDPAQNLEGGARYFKDLLTQYQGNAALALSAYNAGEGAVDRRGKRMPPYPETMLYVPTVLTRAEEIRSANQAADHAATQAAAQTVTQTTSTETARTP